MKRAQTFLELIFSIIFRFKKTTILLVFLAILSAFYFGYQEHQEQNIETYKVQYGKLQEDVSLTGTVKPSEEANMSFQKTGMVKKIFVDVGEKVKEGDVLASLTYTDDEAKVAEAQANLKAAQASLLDLQTSRPETLEIKRVSVDKSANDLEQSYSDSVDSLKNLSIAGNNYVRVSFSQLFTGDVVSGYRVVNSTCNSATESKLNIQRTEAEKSLIDLESKLSQIQSMANGQDKENLLKTVQTNDIPMVTNFLSTLKDIYYSNCYNGSNQYDDLRSTITTVRTSWASLSNDYTTKLSNIYKNKLLYIQAQEDLKISQTGEKQEKVSAQDANVLAAKARLGIAIAERDKNILKAPFNGVITNIDIKVGELVAPGGKTISIISDNGYEIESKVSEIDVAKISQNASATVSFDAYGDELNFDAYIANISPAGIISEGVPTYKTIFNFTKNDDRIRSGLTVNIKVKIKEHPAVISVPAEYIQIDENGERYVYVYRNEEGSREKRPIKTGSIGVKGEIEILSGLEEGETVMIQK
jgi:HlyD family secretion protein